MTDEDLKAEIEQLRAENERLKKPPERGLSMKVSPKGALSLYGMGRFPVTALQGAMGTAARRRRRYTHVSQGERRPHGPSCERGQASTLT